MHQWSVERSWATPVWCSGCVREDPIEQSHDLRAVALEHGWRYPEPRVVVLRGWGTVIACVTACLLLALTFTATEARTATTATPAMSALGDSLTRGWGAGGSAADFVSASWSTGTDATVASHFQRLASLQPGLTASNVAVSGSKMAATSSQADAAVAAGATYVTLLSGTNDVCTSSVALMTSVSSFTTQARTALTKLAAVPGTSILLASIPDWYALWSDHNANPTAASAWAMRNVCPTIFGSETTDVDRAAARQRITDFNSALATVCAEFTQCTYDGGATHGLRFLTGDLAFDFFHLSVAGQARLAEATWNVGPFTQPPANQSPPVVSGTAQVGQSLSATTGTWSGSPTSFSHQWLRCNAGGGACANITGATASTYLVAAADLGSTLRARVTATNGAGSSAADSAATAVVTDAPSGVPPGFTSIFVDPGCGGCSVSAIANGLRATIAGAANTADTAYGVQDFGGAGGVPGRVYVRDVLALAQAQSLSANLAVLQVRDNAGTIVYELYVAADRSLRLYSRAGGLRSTSINLSTGVLVPNNGSATIRVEVSALANSSVIVRVDDVQRISLTGLSGATSGNQRYLYAGIDHYDGTSSQAVSSEHTYVGTSQTTWLGAPG